MASAQTADGQVVSYRRVSAIDQNAARAKTGNGGG
jgi:hypothetical protein